MDPGQLGIERMNPAQIAAVAETHFNDLQADVEAGSRQLDHIHETAREIRDALFVKQFEQAALMGSLVRQVLDLRECLKQQRQTMRELRHDIRQLRNVVSHR
jgi:predicted  nucleic acid-binding Zn-ribbon protein